MAKANSSLFVLVNCTSANNTALARFLHSTSASDARLELYAGDYVGAFKCPASDGDYTMCVS